MGGRAHTGALPQHLDGAGGALEFPGEVFRVGQHEWMVCGRHNAAACLVCTAVSEERTASPHAGEDSLHLPQNLHDGGGAAPASSPPAAPASPPRRPGDVAPASPPPAAPTSPPRARTPASPPPASPRARTPATPPRSRRRRPCDFAPASSSPASPPRPHRRHLARTRRGCGAARTSTPAGSASPPDADESGLAGGAAENKKAAAADVYMARADRGRWMDRFMVTIALGPRFWVQEFLDWVYVMRGSPRNRIRDQWTWIGVLGDAIEQHDNSCVINSALVCLGARHRLDFERRHGYNTFPFHIPAGTVQFFKRRCKERGVWNREEGANEKGVLGVIRQAGGATAARSVPGWKLCKLQVDWKLHYCYKMPPSEIANLIYTEGPLLGKLTIGTDYYADGWEDKVYRGAPAGQVAEPHSVVCVGYRYDTIGQPHGDKELQIEAMDNQRPLGPVRWIAAVAFTLFTEVHVEPLDVNELQLKKKTPWWRRLLSTFTWIFRR